jgi:acyl-CoA reductase-like NAD-dependent aldehyde dehydrogenase
VIRSTNPARLDQVIGEFEAVDPAGFVDACRAAHSAQPGWAAVPAPIRGRVVAALGRLVEANFEALAGLVCDEVGKPIVEARGEVQEIVDTCDFFLGEGRRLYGQTVPSEMADKVLMTRRRPVGVAAVITAGNFPVAVPSWYLVPALLCGNTVVWKPADYAPACADALLRLCRAAGFPAGVVDVVHADGQATFEGLSGALEAGLVDKVGFTGSTAVGREIGSLCGRHLQSPCLELGGKNPMVVWEDADVELAVEGALFSGFGTAGQRCTSLGTAIVHEAVYDRFLAGLVEAVEAAAIGDPRSDAVLYGPMLDEKFAASFEKHLGLIRSHHEVGGSSALGRITAASPRAGFVGDPGAGLYYHPAVVSGLRIDDELPNTETFGPMVGVARVSSLDEAMAWANGHGYGLSSSVYTTSPQVAFRFQERVSAGMVSVNNSTSGAEAHLPFGGNGRSGNGSRQSGLWVLDQFTRWQAVNWDYSGALQRAQMDTMSLDTDMGFRL